VRIVDCEINYLGNKKSLYLTHEIGKKLQRKGIKIQRLIENEKKMIKVDSKEKYIGNGRCSKKALQFIGSYFGFVCPKV
jgi:hypothetical protein